MINETNLHHSDDASLSSQLSPISLHVGTRIRRQRLFLALTQEQLAGKLEITGQEIENYESGMIRIDPLRLFELSQALGVSVAFFFAETLERAAVADLDDPKIHQLTYLNYEALKRDEASDLVMTFQRIPEFSIRMCILDFIRSMVPRNADEAELRLIRGPNAKSMFARLASMTRGISNHS